ncbi:hypothetical protein PMAYCL1PPCAC_00193 [Pristionchus mayeri]|uniref:Uncharacterized protein n=1 Tax=Pristionchus mayeri TaxID=1317129 RepID=A0AAN4Z130_9BILA|nr:hypothetical protein PMAYCL1PPCAC_00193 [Pristionchus mayeri]
MLVSGKLIWNACIMIDSLARKRISVGWSTICFSSVLSIICFSCDLRRSIDALYAISIRRRIPSDLSGMSLLCSDSHLLSTFFTHCSSLNSSPCRLAKSTLPRSMYTLRSSFKIAQRLFRTAAVSSSFSVASVSQNAKAIRAMNSILSGLTRLYSSLIVSLNSKVAYTNSISSRSNSSQSINEFEIDSSVTIVV